jgi:sec-independent protein translocase protein TatA
MIPGVPSMGGLELIILLVIILLLFGAKRIPALARSLGKGMGEFRKGISEGALEEDKEESREEKDQEEKQPLEEGAAPREEEVPHEISREGSQAEGNGTVRAAQKP